MMPINIHQWLNLKWEYMALGHPIMPIFRGYLNALVEQAYKCLDFTFEEE